MYNLNTKRAIVEEGGVMEWESGSFGSNTSYLNPKTIHYATRIDGDVQDVFTYLTHGCELMENAPAVHHYVLHFTMNCNSPTEEN